MMTKKTAAAMDLEPSQGLANRQPSGCLSKSFVFGKAQPSGCLSKPSVSSKDSGSCLSDDQIDDYLIDDLAPSASTHLAECAACEARLMAAKAPLAGFASVTLAWSERRSATIPMQRFTSRQIGWYQRLAWGASMAAALTVGVAIPVANHQARLDDETASLTQTADSMQDVAVPEARIANDNQMLQAIDNELNASVESPQTLGLEPANGTPQQTGQPSSLRN